MNKEQSPSIVYPYIHPEGTFRYVDSTDEFMLAAKEFAHQNSLDDTMPTGTVLVKDGEIIGRGANGSNYHKEHGCERVRLNIPTGQGYDLCEGCSPKNHSEPKAIADAQAHDKATDGAEAYLWGHWWCCEPCWKALIGNGIQVVYLQTGSEVLFNKEATGNIIGHQFDVQ